jgi:hypothetical protein
MSKGKRHCPLCGSSSDNWADVQLRPAKVEAPWEKAGVSRRTYYRRLQVAREYGEAHDKAHDKAKERE